MACYYNVIVLTFIRLTEIFHYVKFTLVLVLFSINMMV